MSYQNPLQLNTHDTANIARSTFKRLAGEGWINTTANQAAAGAKPAHSAIDYEAIKEAGSYLQDMCHGASHNAGWWTHKADGHTYDLVGIMLMPQTPLEKLLSGALVAQKLCLTHSEVSEAMEGHRKGLMDDKLPHRPMLEVELADAVIRLADLAGALGLDLGCAIAEKMAFNANRADHKPEARAAAGGKTY